MGELHWRGFRWLGDASTATVVRALHGTGQGENLLPQAAQFAINLAFCPGFFANSLALCVRWLSITIGGDID